ncbi:MAG TPA: hypothetical protein VGB70_09385 [Allosphingosinicella sp.]|jgi:hypothetical protein
MSAWRNALDKILRGDANKLRDVRLGATPNFIVAMGLDQVALVMTAGKIAKARREHPEVPLSTWHTLPALLEQPKAVFPSSKNDGSLIVVIDAEDALGNPIIVPVIADRTARRNVVLTLYGKSATDRHTGDEWIKSQLEAAKRESKKIYVREGFADSEPKPKADDALSSPGLIPVDGPAKPQRSILTLPSKVKGES